eukprot:Hpha_TRINITY_DN3998_c0_g1::TRINITY_DN3998_c0_g1_i1::g.17968::m.17968
MTFEYMPFLLVRPEPCIILRIPTRAVATGKKKKRDPLEELPVGLFAFSFDDFQWNWIPVDGHKLPPATRLTDFKTKYAAVSAGDRILIQGGNGMSDRFLAVLGAGQDYSEFRVDLNAKLTGGSTESRGLLSRRTKALRALEQEADDGEKGEASLADKRGQYMAPGEKKLMQQDIQVAKARKIDRQERKISFWRMVDTAQERGTIEEAARRAKRNEEDTSFKVPFSKDMYMPGILHHGTPMVTLRNPEEIRQWEENFYNRRYAEIEAMWKSISKDDKKQRTERPKADKLDLDVAERMYQGHVPKKRGRTVGSSPAFLPHPPPYNSQDDVIMGWEMGTLPTVGRAALKGTPSAAVSRLEISQSPDGDAEGEVGEKREVEGHGWEMLRKLMFPEGPPKISRPKSKKGASPKGGVPRQRSAIPSPGASPRRRGSMGRSMSRRGSAGPG